MDQFVGMPFERCSGGGISDAFKTPQDWPNLTFQPAWMLQDTTPGSSDISWADKGNMHKEARKLHVSRVNTCC